MFIYYIVLFLVYGGFLITYNIKSPKYIQYSILILIALIICFGYTNGSDWRNYEKIYDSYNENDFYWRFLYVEPGYLILNILGNIFKLDFWVWYISIKLLLFWKIIDIVQKYCPCHLTFLSLTFYFGIWGILHFMDPSFRNMLAAFVFFCSIKFILNGNFWKFFLCVLIAISFHYSAIILILFYPLFRQKFKTQNLIIFYFVINLCLLNPSFLFNILGYMFSGIEPIVLKIQLYSGGGNEEFMGQGKIMSFGFILHSIIFFLILYSRTKIEKLPYGWYIFNVSSLFIFIFRLGLSSLIFSRLQLFINIFYAIGVACCIYSIVKNERIIYSFLIFLVSCVSLNGQMKDYKFVPYTNYLIHMNENWSFDKRSEYNKRNSPYKVIRLKTK